MFELDIAKLATPLAIAAAVFAAGGLTDRLAPIIGANARIAHFKAEAVAARSATRDANARADAWTARAQTSDGLRSQEHAQAVQAATEAQASCDARVASARRAAAAIQKLVTKEVPRDPQGCPVRQLVDPRELFDAVAAPPDR